MKRVVLAMILIALIMTTLFVSCDNNLSKDAGTASVRFATAENVARGLNKVNPELNPADLYWKYEAVKKDDVGLSTGATSKQELIRKDGKLRNPVGPFSLGDWEFTLYGYVDSEATKLAYTGKTTATIKADKVNNVAVTVKALMTSDGFIEFPAKGVIELKDKKNQPIQNYKEIIVISKADDGSAVQTLTDSTERKVTVASGSYKVTVKYTNSDESLIYGENAIYINVWDNLTTKIGGSLDEITGNTTFNPNDGTATATQEIKTDTVTNIAVNSSPVSPEGGAAEEIKTTVEIPAGIVSGTKAKLGVKAYSADTVGDLAVFDETSAVIGGLDLTLTVDDKAVTEFTSPVTVTTYIAKGLTGVNVKYVGDGKQPTDVAYDDVTGKLTFKTTHFSEFYVTSAEVIVNEVYYSTMCDALTKVLEDSEVLEIDLTLLKDSEVTKHFDINKSLTIRLNGFKLTQAEGLKARPFKVVKDDIKVEFDGTKEGSSLWVSPKEALTEKQNYGILEIAGDNVSVTLNGGNYLGNTDSGSFIIIKKNINPEVETKTASITIKNAVIETNSYIIYTDDTLESENLVVENCKIKLVNADSNTRKAAFLFDNMEISKVNALFTNVDIETDGALPVEASGLWTSFNNCNFKVTSDMAHFSWNPTAITASFNGKTDVNSGSFYSVQYGAYIYSSGGEINIKEGVTIESPYAAIYASNMNSEKIKAVINISGGKIIGPIINNCTNDTSKIIITGGTFEGTLESKKNDNIVIKGGSFNSDPSVFVPTGFKATQNSEGRWIVSVE